MLGYLGSVERSKHMKIIIPCAFSRLMESPIGRAIYHRPGLKLALLIATVAAEVAIQFAIELVILACLVVLVVV